MTLTGYGPPEERQNVNTLLQPLGVSDDATQILQRQGDSTFPVTEWIGPHPVVDGISGGDARGRGHQRLRTVRPAPVGPPCAQSAV